MSALELIDKSPRLLRLLWGAVIVAIDGQRCTFEQEGVGNGDEFLRSIRRRGCRASSWQLL
ncbi:hypothetical protein [Pseudothauera rhizosphaerae]|uniref:hypothetical protein n=1 Tax=Pseudothauera rhizosphaerae TaxID=2565932 RepID=UPI001454CDF2|nr:hypothetical protein [Pseudothauera rhizosphaerae]